LVTADDLGQAVTSALSKLSRIAASRRNSQNPEGEWAVSRTYKRPQNSVRRFTKESKKVQRAIKKLAGTIDLEPIEIDYINQQREREAEQRRARLSIHRAIEPKELTKQANHQLSHKQLPHQQEKELLHEEPLDTDGLKAYWWI